MTQSLLCQVHIGRHHERPPWPQREQCVSAAFSASPRSAARPIGCSLVHVPEGIDPDCMPLDARPPYTLDADQAPLS
jgi:hypothetical protein